VHCVCDVNPPWLRLQQFRATFPLANVPKVPEQTPSTLCIVTDFNEVSPVCVLYLSNSTIDASRLDHIGKLQVLLFNDSMMLHVRGTLNFYVRSISVSHRDTFGCFPLGIRPASVLLKVIVKHNLRFSSLQKIPNYIAHSTHSGLKLQLQNLTITSVILILGRLPISLLAWRLNQETLSFAV